MQKISINEEPFGKINILNENGTIIDEYQILRGRFSIIEKENFHLINFWVESYKMGKYNGKRNLASGPALEILTKTFVMSEILNHKMPSLADIENELEENYDTCYYNGWYNDLLDAEIKFEKMKDNLYKIGFRGRPSEDNSQNFVCGECEIQLTDEIQRRW